MAIDQMKEIRLISRHLGYGALAEAANDHVLADPPVEKGLRQSILHIARTGLKLREQRLEDESAARSRVILRSASPKFEFVVIKHPTEKLRQKIEWISSFIKT